MIGLIEPEPDNNYNNQLYFMKIKHLVARSQPLVSAFINKDKNKAVASTELKIYY